MWVARPDLTTEHPFRRQHPIGPYVVDFVCPGRKLAIELDGGQHAQRAEETPPAPERSCDAAIASSAFGTMTSCIISPACSKSSDENWTPDRADIPSPPLGGEGGDPSRQRWGG